MRWDEENREEMKSEAAGAWTRKFPRNLPIFPSHFLLFLSFLLFFFKWQIFDLWSSSTGIIKNQKIYLSSSPSLLIFPHLPPYPVSYLSDKTALSETRNRHESSDSELGVSRYSLYIQICESYPLYSNWLQIIFKLTWKRTGRRRARQPRQPTQPQGIRGPYVLLPFTVSVQRLTATLDALP